ncbi:MAG: FAD-dependent oxidoreductase, partial [Planctomycetota bacterium]
MKNAPRGPSSGQRHRVVILGAGFAGLRVAKRLRKAPVDVVIVDRQNHHLFQPLLYQVATAGLAGPDIAAPIRRILRRHHNTRVIYGEVEKIDPEGQTVHVQGDPLRYDTLVVATGATHSYFGHDEWEQYAPGLKTLGDAQRIRSHV